MSEMDELQNEELQNTENEIMRRYETFETENAEDVLNRIKPRLKNKCKKSPGWFTVSRIVALASSVILMIGIGLLITLETNKPSDEPPRYGSSDNISWVEYTENEVSDRYDIYVPKFDVLSNCKIKACTDKVTNYIYYFLVTGTPIVNEYVHDIQLKIIIDKNYDVTTEVMYIEGEKHVINEHIISIYTDKSDGSLYNFYVGFSDDGIRYYMDIGAINSDINQITLLLYDFL